MDFLSSKFLKNKGFNCSNSLSDLSHHFKSSISLITESENRFLTIFPGTPATITLSLTSFETTAPAAIILFFPIVTPGNIVALVPIHTFSLICIGLEINVVLSSGFIL